MKVIQFLSQYTSIDEALKQLTQQFNIIVKEYANGLIVLNYNQIESPKTHDIVRECRGLIIDTDLNIVSRSFDRFFNFGENNTTFNPHNAVCYEKIDGSLIKIYHWKNKWHISTRGTAGAESEVNGFGLSFEQLVLKAIPTRNLYFISPSYVNLMDEFQEYCNEYLNSEFTYICEITAMENRVVTRYHGYTLWFLAKRHNQLGTYSGLNETEREFPFTHPKQFKFDNVEHCLETAKQLPDLQEGYVVYEAGIPVCKIKSPAYVATHLIRGEGLNPKRIAQLLAINEQDEYLQYYPEDKHHFEQVLTLLVEKLTLVQSVFSQIKHIEDKRTFALSVNDLLPSDLRFLCFEAFKRKHDNISQCFWNLPVETRVKFIMEISK